MQVEECAAIRLGMGGMLEVSGCKPSVRRSATVAGIEVSEGEGCWQPVAQTSIPTPWGAARSMLCCPCCRRRVRALHRPLSRRRWACRTCWGLTYASRQGWDKRVDSALASFDPAALLLLPISNFPSALVAIKVLYRLAYPSNSKKNSAITSGIKLVTIRLKIVFQKQHSSDTSPTAASLNPQIPR